MTKKPKKPAHLARRGGAFWSQIVDAYDLEQHDMPLLVGACELLDRAEAARKQIDTDGLTITDRFGQMKPHPCIDTERQSLLAYIRLRRELGIDVEPPADSRPPLLRGYR
jgi:phage terminase small subunit